MDLKQFSRFLREIREEWHKPLRSERIKNREIMAANTYERWAFDEIYLYVFHHDNLDERVAIEELMVLADEKACLTNSGDVNLMFNILYDICREVLDVLRAMKGE